MSHVTFKTLALEFIINLIIFAIIWSNLTLIIINYVHMLPLPFSSRVMGSIHVTLLGIEILLVCIALRIRVVEGSSEVLIGCTLSCSVCNCRELLIILLRVHLHFLSQSRIHHQQLVSMLRGRFVILLPYKRRIRFVRRHTFKVDGGMMSCMFLHVLIKPGSSIWNYPVHFIHCVTRVFWKTNSVVILWHFTVSCCTIVFYQPLSCPGSRTHYPGGTFRGTIFNRS